MRLQTRNLVFTILFLFFLGEQTYAITFDNAGSVGDFTLGGVRVDTSTPPNPRPLTFTLNINAAANALYVGVSNNRTLTAMPGTGGCPATGVQLSTTGTVTNITTTNGTTARTDFERYTTSGTIAQNAVVSPNGCASVEIFRLKNPPSGTNTISVSIPAGGDYIVIGAASFIGVDLSNQPSTVGALNPNSGAGSNPSVTVSTPANGIVLDTVADEFSALDIIIPPSAGNQTRLWRMSSDPPPPPPFYVGAGSMKPVVNVSSVTTNWQTTNSANWAVGGIFLKEVSTATQSTLAGQVRTNLGAPLANISVFLQDLQTGESVGAATDENGRYYFENLNTTHLYQVKVFSFYYNFSPGSQIFNPIQSLGDVDFVAARRTRKRYFGR